MSQRPKHMMSKDAHPVKTVGAGAADVFESNRPRLISIAYRILGSRFDAEDVVQDCGVRWLGVEPDKIDNPAAWLTTVVTRRAIDVLRSKRRARLQYVGQWLPEPSITDTQRATEDQLELASSLSTAFLLILERLSPKERAAYLLHEVFETPYADVAGMLGVKEPACRKLVSRAKKRVKLAGRRARPPMNRQKQMLAAFETAIRTGDPGDLGDLLVADVQLHADGGGKVAAILDSVEGRDVLAFVTRKLHLWWADFRWSVEEINGLLGIVLRGDGDITAVVTFAYDASGRVSEIQIMRNPDKLRAINARSVY